MGQGDRSPSPVAHVRAPVPPVPVFSGLSGRLEGQLSNLAASTFRLGDRSPAANATTAVDGAAYISVINNSLSSNSLAIHSLTRHADSSRQGNASVVETAQLAQRFDNTMATIKNLAASITKPPLPPGQPAPPPEDKASEKPSAEQAEKRRAATARRSSMEAPPPPPPQASSSQPPRGAGAAPMRSISASASRGSGPRGLVLKLEKYRNDPLALEELHRRAKEQQEERLQQSMRRTSGQAVNFVAENRRALGMPADMGLVAMVIGGGSAGMSTASLDALKREVPLLASLSRNRPANGGSPTSRAEFLAERVIRTTEQRARSKSAKTRAESHLGAMLAQREQLGSKWEEWRAAQERKQAEEEAAMKRRKQQETWATVVALGSRLSALRNQLFNDRKNRRSRIQRKEAAVRIATYYKSILVRRQTGARAAQFRRLINALTPLVSYLKQRVRRLAAERVVRLLQTMAEADSALLAVRHFVRHVVVLQRAWRARSAAAKARITVVYKFIQVMERELIKENKKRMGPAVDEKAGGGSGPKNSTLKGSLGASSGRIAANLETVGSITSGRLSRAVSGRVDAGAGRATPAGGKASADAVLRSSGSLRRQAGGESLPQAPPPPKPLAKMLPNEILGYESTAGIFINMELAQHVTPLPRKVRFQIVDMVMQQLTAAFEAQLDKWVGDMKAYQEQRPLEEVRLKLLRDAGIAAVSELRKPDRPVFRVKISKPHFRVMLYHGIHLLRRMEEDHEATAAFLGLEGDVDDIHQLLLEFNDAKQSSRNIAMLDKELSSMAVGGGGGGGLPSSPSKAALSSQRSVSKLGLTSQASFGALGGSGRLKSPSPLRRSGSSVASKLAASTPTAAAGASARSGGNMTPKAPLAPVAELSRSGRL